jgi:Mg2+-importing ATPase
MPDLYWTVPTDQLLAGLASGPGGLSGSEAQERLGRYGPNQLKREAGTGRLVLLLRQFKSPITLLLIASALLAWFLGERTDAIIIWVIVGISALLGYYQEAGAAGALRRLLRLVQVTVTVVRDGQELAMPVEELVPGDIVVLGAGNTVPGDCRLLESRDLFTNEASLTGESFPVEKRCGSLLPEVRLGERNNVLFMGTHVLSGVARAVVVKTGLATEFGAISGRLRHLQPEAEFTKGIRRLGYLLMEVTMVLVLVTFCINVLLHKPALDSFLFSLAIAVGLTPQLLPAIISINLAKGAAAMAKKRVIVKRLEAIENLGSMDVFCTDKTGTLTTGEIVLDKATGPDGAESGEVLRLAYLNAFWEKGFVNPIDAAITAYRVLDVSGVRKRDELPYDFSRKRLSVLVEEAGGVKMITKGAFDNVLAVCGGLDDPRKAFLREQYVRWSGEGFRVLGVAYKDFSAERLSVGVEDESEMVFAGMLVFTDELKPGIAGTLRQLEGLGVSLKIITGDNELVAAQISRDLGLGGARGVGSGAAGGFAAGAGGFAVGVAGKDILCGEEIREMSVEALSRVAGGVRVFAAVEPNQKEKIVLALKRAGHVVGYMGDGINDAPALHTADVGISVNGAADVARSAADIVLLGNDLAVLVEGVREGRKTFANTLKYIFMATSANFGNMFSMAGASLFLPFLPLLPKQVLLTNLLTDIPEMAIAGDSVDELLIARPRRISLRFIRRFMIVFGLISSIFDYATFGILLYWLRSSQAEFRTGWFVESVISASLIVLVVRTSQVFYRNRPGRWLLLATIGVVAAAALLPLTPLAGLLGFVRLPLRLYGAVGAIVVLYVITAEVAKRIFYRGAR